MTTIETTSAALAQQESRTNHAMALLNALAPDPSKWEYRGECLEGDENSKCACGHPIRWLFPIYFGEQQKVVGSTCVNHFAAINPETGALMLEALERLQTKLSDQRKAALKATADSENAALWAQYSQLRDTAIERHNSNRGRYIRSPWELWFFVAGRSQYRRLKTPEYVRACDLKKWLVKAIAAAERALSATA